MQGTRSLTFNPLKGVREIFDRITRDWLFCTFTLIRYILIAVAYDSISWINISGNGTNTRTCWTFPIVVHDVEKIESHLLGDLRTLNRYNHLFAILQKKGKCE